MAIYLPNISTENNEKRAKGVRDQVRKKRISYLTHFTRSENLKSILQTGILPASILKQNRAFSSVIYTPQPLPAQWSGFVSLNISFPDYKLFLQMQNHQAGDWVVLLIDSRVLADFPCYYFPDRATSFIESAPVPGLPLEEFRSVKAFKELFAEREDIKRRELEIPDSYPTNPCSEVLCSFPIAPSSISQVWFYSEYKFNQWVLSNTQFALEQDRNRWACGMQYFSPRSDYTFWKTQRPLQQY